MKHSIHHTIPNHSVTDTLKQRQRRNHVCDWLQLLEALDVQFLVLDPASDRVAVELARAHPAWQVEFEDSDAVFFAHTRAQGGYRDQPKNPSIQPGDTLAKFKAKQ
jgi:hypothetical protein